MPRWILRPFAAFFCALGFIGGGVLAPLVYIETPHGSLEVADAICRDRFAAFTQIIVMGAGLLTVFVSYSARMRQDHIGEYYALLVTAGAGMAFLVQSANLMTLFLGLEWFSVCLYILCAIEIDLVGSLEAGLKYLIIGGMGSAVLLFGSALDLRLDRGARLLGDRGRDASPEPVGRPAPARRARDDPRRARVQVVGRAVPHVDAGRLRGRADAGHRLHGRGDEDGRARPHVPRARGRVPGGARRVDDRRRGAGRASRSRGATSPRSSSRTSSGCSRTRRSRTRASC